MNRMRTKHETSIQSFSVSSSGIENQNVHELNAGRRATDLAFGICIVIMMLVVFGLGVYGLAKGDPLKFVAPVNGYGDLCG